MYHQYERQSEYSTILKVILDAKKINMQIIRKKKLFYGGHISMVDVVLFCNLLTISPP